ncbi:5208_t:CDS:2, partial [Racocetra fulgida]
LDVILDEQMIFFQYKTITKILAYQHQSLKYKQDNVSLLILIEKAELVSHIVLNNSTTSYINKKFFKASDLLSNEFNEINSEANTNNELKTNINNKSEAKNDNK